MTSPSVEFQIYNVTIFSDGSIHRAPFDPPPVPPCPSPSSPHQVASKDLIIDTTHAISARLFLPPRIDDDAHSPKLPILLYFFGSGFFTGNTFLPPYHHFLCKLARHVNVLIVSINYRLAPEHSLPVAYEDGFRGLMWVEEQAKLGASGESWLASFGDFDRCFLGGDSAGGTITHYVAMQAAGYKPWDANADAETSLKMKHVCLQGMILFNPFFTCGRVSAPSPVELAFLKYNKIKYVDDPLADPFSPAAPSLANVRLPRALVFVAGLDHLKNRGVVYHQNLVDAGMDATIVLHEDEPHGFQVNKPESPNILPLLDKVKDFIDM